MDHGLLEPITADQPCGQDLEYTDLPRLESFRLFGEATPPDARPDPREPSKRLPPPPWDEIKTQARDGLSRSKDLRLLAYLGTASLRTDGLPAFAETLTVASEWLKTYWAETYPRIDGDAVLRRSALDCFADPMAVIDGLRRMPLVSSRLHGTFSFRDVEIATGHLAPAESDAKPDEARIKAAFAEMPPETIDGFARGVTNAVAALKSITSAMGAGAGPDAMPDFEPLMTLLGRMNRTVAAHRGVAVPAAGEGREAEDAVPDSGTSPVGVIKSRQDAVRALDAVAEFFRRTEPSSPIPLLVDRAKRLVSKDFLEVLADVAPDAVAQARAAGGLKQAE